MQKIDNYSSTDVERTTIYFGKNAINQAYTLIGNFTDATMIMTAREDQLIDVVIGATFNDLQDTNSSRNPVRPSPISRVARPPIA